MSSEEADSSLKFIAEQLELSNKIAWYHVEPLSARGLRLRRQIEAELDRWEP